VVALMLGNTNVRLWFEVAALLIPLSAPMGLGCAGQERTTCGFAETWKAHQRYREYSASELPITRAGIDDAVAVDLAAVACARRRDGTVGCWEADESWSIPALDDARSIAVGTHGACAVRETGAVVCWNHGDVLETVSTERVFRETGMEQPPSEEARLVTVHQAAGAERVCVSRSKPNAGDVAGYTSGTAWACAHTPVAGVPCWAIESANRVEPNTRITHEHRHAESPSPTSPGGDAGRVCPPAVLAADGDGARSADSVRRALRAYQEGVAALDAHDFEQAQRLFGTALGEAPFLELLAAAGGLHRMRGNQESSQRIRERYVACGGEPRRFDEWDQLHRPDEMALAADSVGEPDECSFRARQRHPCDRALAEALQGTRFSSDAVGSDEHACAVDDTGQVWCWGRNDMGQLGDGTRQDRESPVKVRGLSDAVSVGVGFERTCAVRQSGRVACWGVGAKPRSEWNRTGEEAEE